MDKDNKFADTGNEIDSEADELLRDLDDEDDSEEYPPVRSEMQPSRSLVNILAASTGIESLSTATLPNIPAVPHLSTPPSDALRTKPVSSPVNPSVAGSSGLGAKSAANIPVPNSEEAESKSEEPVDEAEENSEINKMDAIWQKGISVQPSIKPFESHAAEHESDEAADKSEADSVKPADTVKNVDSIKPADTARNAESSDEKQSEEEHETGRAGDVRNSGKRPPVPPKPGSLPVCSRLSQDAINDMLPGGKNDEARDLAYKFNDNNWYSLIFNEDYLRTVPQSSPRQTLRESKFIVDRLGLQSGARVLDLCCGFGRHTIELASRGFDMVGLDLSMVMLKRALADAQNRGQAIKFVHGDMRKLTFKSIFDAIYNVDTSFGYFDDLSNFKVLQGIFRALKPGGLFMLETINRDFIMNDLPLRLWWKGRECTLLEEIDMEPLSGLLKVQRSFVYDDKTRAPWEQKIQIRLYTVPEMRQLLSRAGFQVIELSGDYSLPGAYFGASSTKNIFIAERPTK